jgi:streptogramin lyase
VYRTITKTVGRSVLAILVACPLSAYAESHKAELLGIPIKSVVFGNSQGVLAKGPNGQADMFYISYYSTTGCELIGYHAATKERVAIRLDSLGGYGCCVGTDGALYVGGVNPGNLYRYDPATKKVENLAGRQFGVQYIWAAAASSDGKVYGACYPTCSVIEYNIATRTLRDLGRVAPGEQYARWICLDHRGKVWVGIGNRAHLIVLDPGTGERRDVLPAKYRHNSTCSPLVASGKYVLAGVLYDGATLVFDADTEKVVRVVPRPKDSVWWKSTAGAPAGEAYLATVPNGDLYHYDIEKDCLTPMAVALGQCERVVEKRYVHGISDQDYFLFDLKENRFLDRTRLAQAKDGMEIYTLTGAADGNIYGSTYINQHIFRCDARSGKLTDLGKVVRIGGQVDSIHAGRDGKVYLGSYVLATLSIYDPAKPWNPGRDLQSNPRELGSVGHGQYRTRAIALGPDDHIYVGSIPSYNSAPTGALSRWNPRSGAHESWLDLVPGGAVDRIAVDDKYVYCAGGGRFFVWDPKAETKRFEAESAVLSLVAAPGGKIVGNRGDQMFVFDPTLLRMVETFASPIGPMDYMTVAPNGKLYGINGSALGEIDPATWSAKKIAQEGGRFLAADGDSHLYFARGTELYRLK